MIAILDLGSQYTQLIAKSLRDLKIKSQVFPGNISWEDLSKNESLEGLIFSGSPMSVADTEKFLDTTLFEAPLPKLCICFAYQWIAEKFGGNVSVQSEREYGAAEISLSEHAAKDPLFSELSTSSRVWMSHGDSVSALPKQASLLASSSGRPAAFSLPEQNLWALQFHPEVHHSVEGAKLLESFARNVCKVSSSWSLEEEYSLLEQNLKKELEGVDRVYCAVSGGVDSTVMAVFLSQFVSVEALFVDHGFLRSYDESDLKKVFADYPQIHLRVLDERDLFWKELKGVSDPEEKRKKAGKLFVDAFHGALPQGKKFHLAQGTIYSDVIESAGKEATGAHKIKSHHNVGGLPENLDFHLVEPLRSFFKDDVRALGRKLGIQEAFLERHPFPGPGLMIRVLGSLEPERVEVLKKCDEVFHRELRARNLYRDTWQALVVLLPVNSVGVMGDGRSYESVACIRAVSSREAMTAEASEFPWKDLKEIAATMVNEVQGINRVVYDLSSKPPATIEWE